jgi:hypothetical protein
MAADMTAMANISPKEPMQLSGGGGYFGISCAGPCRHRLMPGFPAPEQPQVRLPPTIPPQPAANWIMGLTTAQARERSYLTVKGDPSTGLRLKGVSLAARSSAGASPAEREGRCANA